MNALLDCGVVYPLDETLACLKPAGHDGDHATCLGYHPEPYNEWEWAEWPQIIASAHRSEGES